VTTTAPQGRLLRRGLRVIGRQVALHPKPFVVAVSGAMVYALTTVALLVIGVWRIEQGAITAGTLVGLISLFSLLVWPLRLIGYVLGDMPRAVAGYERVAEVLAEPLPPAAPVASDGLPGGPLELVVDRVGYGYEPGAEMLHEVSFRVPAGDTVALVGPTGSGKSTLALLLARLLDPTGAGSGSASATWPSWTPASWPRPPRSPSRSPSCSPPR